MIRSKLEIIQKLLEEKANCSHTTKPTIKPSQIELRNKISSLLEKHVL